VTNLLQHRELSNLHRMSLSGYLKALLHCLLFALPGSWRQGGRQAEAERGRLAYILQAGSAGTRAAAAHPRWAASADARGQESASTRRRRHKTKMNPLCSATGSTTRAKKAVAMRARLASYQASRKPPPAVTTDWDDIQVQLYSVEREVVQATLVGEEVVLHGGGPMIR
jgi:hypothetical protein